MEISIVIVNFNTRKLTLGCIDSIRRARIKVTYEIIVIDNGSKEEIHLTGKSVVFIKNSENLGFAKANNQGIAKASGKYILLLNSDTVVKKGAIDGLYEFAVNRPGVGAVVPKLLNSDGSLQPSLYMLPTIVRAINQYWLGQNQLLEKYAPKETALAECAVMAAFLITPQAIKKVGLLDEKYFMYFEDFDYCRRLKKAGLNIYYYPKSEIIHLHGASGGTNKYLIESAKKYHGIAVYYTYTLVLWLGQKWEKVFK